MNRTVLYGDVAVPIHERPWQSRRSRAAGGSQRKRRAPFWLSWLLALGIASVGFAQVRAEYEVDLGDGYDAAMIAKPTNAPFEALAHLLFLRHNGRSCVNLAPTICHRTSDSSLIRSRGPERFSCSRKNAGLRLS